MIIVRYPVAHADQRPMVQLKDMIRIHLASKLTDRQ